MPSKFIMIDILYILKFKIIYSIYSNPWVIQTKYRNKMEFIRDKLKKTMKERLSKTVKVD